MRPVNDIALANKIFPYSNYGLILAKVTASGPSPPLRFAALDLHT